jgi:hypothetical protein
MADDLTLALTPVRSHVHAFSYNLNSRLCSLGGIGDLSNRSKQLLGEDAHTWWGGWSCYQVIAAQNARGNFQFFIYRRGCDYLVRITELIFRGVIVSYLRTALNRSWILENRCVVLDEYVKPYAHKATILHWFRITCIIPKFAIWTRKECNSHCFGNNWLIKHKCGPISRVLVLGCVQTRWKNIFAFVVAICFQLIILSKIGNGKVFIYLRSTITPVRKQYCIYQRNWNKFDLYPSRIAYLCLTDISWLRMIQWGKLRVICTWIDCSILRAKNCRFFFNCHLSQIIQFQKWLHAKIKFGIDPAI